MPPAFKIIPVIDIMDGVAVHARRGQRQQYRPVQSVFSPDAIPHHLLAGMQRQGANGPLYVADLDAITGKEAQNKLVHDLSQMTDLWLDQGRYRACDLLVDGRITHVIGSESLRTIQDWMSIVAAIHTQSLVLSLDFDPKGRFIGPITLYDNPMLWPDRVVVMTLDRVGSGLGPDLSLIRQIRERSGQVEIYAAGGVRGASDLDELSQAGVSGALVATALHEGVLSFDDAETLHIFNKL